MNPVLSIILIVASFLMGHFSLNSEPRHFCYFDSHQSLDYTSSEKTYGMVCRYGIPVDFPPPHRKCFGCNETMLSAMGLKEANLQMEHQP